jgi:hypothetical protein
MKKLTRPCVPLTPPSPKRREANMTNNFRTFAERYYARQRKRDRFMEIASWTAGIIGLVSCLGIFWMILVAIP